MNFAVKNKDKLIELYESGESTYSIAKQLNTYPNKIKRALGYLGVKIRSRSEAQKLAIESGRTKHPTDGKTLSEETKLKIGKKSKESWEGNKERKKQAAEQLKNLTPEQIQDRNEKSIAAIRKAAKEGSKLENYLLDLLAKKKYRAESHVKNLRNQDLEVDIFLPDLAIAIEVDGISHVEPIWGQEKFDKQKRADQEKESLLLKNGITIIRVIHTKKNITLSDKTRLGEELLEQLNNIDNTIPTIIRIK